MTGPAPTIRRMKIEDYPLVYGLWTRCTGFTMRDIDDSEDAIKTFLKRNPDTCFVRPVRQRTVQYARTLSL